MPFCPKCGTQVQAGAKFCPRCGATVSQAGGAAPRQAPAAAASAPASSTNRAVAPAGPARRRGVNPLFVGIAAVAVVAVLFIVINPLGWGRAAAPSGDAASQQQQQPAVPATFEDYLISQNTLDSFCTDLRDQFLSMYPLLGGQMKDVQVDVQGNQVSVVVTMAVSSEDTGYFGGLMGALSAEAMNEFIESDEHNAETVASWEQASGIDGITYRYELRNSDGGLLWSHDYTSTPSS